MLYRGCQCKKPHFLHIDGSNEIGSALLNYLRASNLNGIRKIHLFADGCGCQNKNSHIMHLLMYWLHNESPDNIEEIEITFPVRGHSYLPADRVFGRVEKEGTTKRLP